GVASCSTLYNITIELRLSQEESASFSEASNVNLLRSLGSVLHHGCETMESGNITTTISERFSDSYSKTIQLALEIVASMATSLREEAEGISKPEDEEFK